jgi:holo-[acyl-carrier protein] synthase
MSAGVGIDLLEIGRLERALHRRPGLARRVFTEGELEYAGARGRPARHLAARFAAKEAVFKALGLRGALGLREIEVVAGEPPSVRLHGRAKAAAAERGIAGLSISLTHSAEMAAAVAWARSSADANTALHE